MVSQTTKKKKNAELTNESDSIIAANKKFREITSELIDAEIAQEKAEQDYLKSLTSLRNKPKWLVEYQYLSKNLEEITQKLEELEGKTPVALNLSNHPLREVSRSISFLHKRMDELENDTFSYYKDLANGLNLLSLKMDTYYKRKWLWGVLGALLGWLFGIRF